MLTLSLNSNTTRYVAENGSDDGPGTADHPWATINHAAQQVTAGETVVVRGGRYELSGQVRLKNSGRPGAWITFIGSSGEQPVLDAHSIPRSALLEGPLDNGVFQIEGVSYIRVINLAIIDSHDAGIAVRDSSNIDLINNSTNGTFSSGIAVWDTNHQGNATRHIRVLGNSVTRATTRTLAPADFTLQNEAPHEAISIGGAVDFEVAYNHVYGSDKEGIDIKETSQNGTVHHNLVHNVARQGIYVDAWFGELKDVEIYSNIVHDCEGAGLALSVENGKSDQNIKIHNNIIFDNAGSGLYFSGWGANNLRRDITIENNDFYHNGYGPPKPGQSYYWLTGGLYLFSTNVRDIAIKNNIFSENAGFQIGYSDLFPNESGTWQAAARLKRITVNSNLIDGKNDISSPIESEYPPGGVKIFGLNGLHPILGNPLFKDPASQDFTLRDGSAAAAGNFPIGVYPSGSKPNTWWKQDFPPSLVRTH